MPLLILLAVILLVVAAPLLWFLAQSKLRPGATHMVLIGAAASEAESQMWVTALTDARISPHVRNVGDYGIYGTSAYAYEVWVRERDADRAREVLGL